MAGVGKKIAIVGGCGHVGLPLGLAFAEAGHVVTLLDIDASALAKVSRGEMPFREEGGEERLKKYIGKALFPTQDPQSLSLQEVIIFVTSAPLDQYHNPGVEQVLEVVEQYIPFLLPQQLIVLRSTVFLGVSELVHRLIAKNFGYAKVAFCPERIAQGFSLKEIASLPQLIGAFDVQAESEAKSLFASICKKIICLKPAEAEVAKLMTNSWRYLEFAIANQFYVMTESLGFDFHKIYRAVVEDYPRAQGFARPGLTAGPCLLKDTLLLSQLMPGQFEMGRGSIQINEGLPSFLVDQLIKTMNGIAGKKIAILGMTFKADCDDIRQSLSFKLKSILLTRGALVIESDPYLPHLPGAHEAIQAADGIILGVPHTEYRNLKINKPMIDCWGVFSNAEIKTTYTN